MSNSYSAMSSLGAFCDEAVRGASFSLSCTVRIENPAERYRCVGSAYVRCWPKKTKGSKDGRVGLILANVNVSPGLRRRGHFKRFLRVLEREAASRNMDLYIEQVQNPNLLAFFQKHPRYVEHGPSHLDTKVNFVRIRSSK